MFRSSVMKHRSGVSNSDFGLNRSIGMRQEYRTFVVVGTGASIRRSH
jgi:hypothetical protein